MHLKIESTMKSICAVVLLGVASVGANASVIRVAESDFLEGSGMITFSELPLDTLNPVYLPADYGGQLDYPVVSFGGYFLGQSLSATPNTPIAPARLQPLALSGHQPAP
ncbi:MAG: hypothetical protein LBU76_04165 [Azoarcus sp.]|jgi:hypothetical protein|nr:hypothetical protein [Azoarcus sp.]